MSLDYYYDLKNSFSAYVPYLVMLYAVHVQTAMNELNVMELNITNDDDGKKIIYGGYPTFAEHYSRHCLNI